MGTHPNGSAKIAGSDEFLLDWLKQRPEAVGAVPPGYPSNDLPFLFKVLSIRTALSVQVHPDKKFAPVLHAKFPDIYKDANHKPEMSIALTPFEAMCGFRLLSEINDHLLRYPELKMIIGDEECAKFAAAVDAMKGEEERNDDEVNEKKREHIKSLFAAFMHCPDELVNKCIDSLVQRLEKASVRESIHELILRLHKDYPNDRGVLCPLLLNYLKLEPGEAFFMGANEPHAYIQGDCIECMALSDNVVRAGLTPKLKDVETLMFMLHYRSSRPEILQPIQLDSYSKLYRPDSSICTEFEVEQTILPPGVQSYSMLRVNCACMMLLLSGTDCKISVNGGEQKMLVEGSVIFVSANADVILSTGSLAAATIYRAHINLG